MEKKIYKKPEMDVLSLSIKDSVLENTSWGVDGNKEGNIKEGPGEGEGGVELDSRKNESGWDFEW